MNVVSRNRQDRVKRLVASSLYTIVFGKPREIRPPKALDLADVRRILVVRDDNIGDHILSTPAFEALKKACPQAELTLVASTYNAEVVKGNPYIDRILCYEKHKHSPHRWRFESTWRQYSFLRFLRRQSFDLAVGLRSRFKRRHSQTIFASGAPYRLGHSPDRPRDRHLAFLYNIYAPESPSIKHEIERTLDIVKAIGVQHPFPSPHVVIGQIERDFATRVLAVREIKGFPKIGYHISNRKPHLRWPLASFANVIASLMDHYPQSDHLITFSPDDRKRADRLASMLETEFLPRFHLVPTAQIKHLGAIQCHCQLFITVDGAPMHLAAALGIPTVAIFGSYLDTVEWHPWGPGHRWFEKGNEIAAVSPSEVFAAATDMLAQR